ncbi:cyclic GMP-AMP synthase [Trichomycterus rosablanca]|uniref:cyclic GMP-AMP synthase n=1 Tax=Trichomycterus rosablanca TaxID=2290929 RepID=UPI002F352474
MSSRGSSKSKISDKDPRSSGTDSSPSAGKQQKKTADKSEKPSKGNDEGKKTTTKSTSATRAERSAETCSNSPTHSAHANPGVSTSKTLQRQSKSLEETRGNGEVKKKTADKSEKPLKGNDEGKIKAAKLTRAVKEGDSHHHTEKPADPRYSDTPSSPKSDTKRKVTGSVRKAPSTESQTPGASEGKTVRAGGKHEDKKQSPPDASGAVRKKKSIELCRGNSVTPSDPDTTGKDPTTPTSAKGKHGRLVRSGSSVDKSPSKILQDVLDKLRVKKSDTSVSAKCVNDIQEKIICHLKKNLNWCEDINVLKTGSYYEHVKICEPDEFDVMLTVNINRATVNPYSEDGAFYSVEMKRDPKSLLNKFLDEKGTIKASEMLEEFREEVKKAVEPLKETYKINVNRKKKGCPAVTLEVKNDGKEISIDFVLGLEVSGSWPAFTRDGLKIETWLGHKVRMEQRRKPFYLVPKYEGRGNVEQDGVTAKDAWRISFSHVEKDMMINHGNSKTCCNTGPKCCRKDCLKLLKYLVQQLKEMHPKEADELCSYHAKTTLLHACATRVEDSKWAASELSHCFQQLLEDFEKHLKDGQLSNFFIPSQNLLKNLTNKGGIALVNCIQYQRNNGFPLFQQDNTRGTPKQTDVPKLGVCDCEKNTD